MIDTSQILIDGMREHTVTTSAKINIINNTYNNGAISESGKYAIFEGDGIELDGSCNVLQEDKEIEGWYSENISDENGTLNNVGYSKNVSNDKEEISDLHILFSNIRDEYAINFDVIIQHGEEEETYNFRNNTKKEIIINNIETGRYVKIKFYKWSKKYSRAKVLNMYLGAVYKYEDNEIVSINAKKGVDLINEDIQSKELQIKLVDDDTYNIFTESIWDKFDTDTRIEIFLGVLIDNFIYYVKVDECYFKKIEKENDELAITITGIGIISKYQDVEWYKLYNEIYLTPWTLKTIVSDYNGTNEKFYNLLDRIKVDEELIKDNQEIIRCYERNMKINEYLNSLASNCRSNLIETYNNNIYFKRIKEELPVATINLENMEEYPEIEKQKSKYNILIKKYGYSTSKEKQEVFKGKFTVSKYGSAHLNPYENIDFLSSDNYEFVLNIYNSDGSVYESNITSEQSDFAILVIPSTILFVAFGVLKDKIFEITVNCKTISFANSDYKVINYDEQSEEKTIDIRSIQDEETAKKVGQWLASNLNKKFKFKIKINDTFTYELGDTVELETGVYENEEMVVRKAIVTGIEYEYNGTLDYYLILEGE